ncbi:hypothetical protein DL96DRAFT_1572745 [Flagelloscypha sp. PMI_526]|nr:hypothetical protein DL96DRAFT_1572745 [Flagelloscypha sp. PMI_526]
MSSLLLISSRHIIRTTTTRNLNLKTLPRRFMSIPQTVQAIAIDEIGDFDVIQKKTLPFKPDPSEVVVKTEWFGVNFIDTYYRKGLYPLKEFPAQLGKEASGVVAALPTDPKVLNDPKFQRLGLKVGSSVAIDKLGSFAEYVSVPWVSTYPLPAAVDTRTAAAAYISGMTALTFSEESYAIKKGDNIFVHAAAGSFGLLLTQIAKHKGATVIGTTSTEEKAKLATENGVDHIIIYTKEDVVKRVLELTNGEGVDAIYDGVGKDTFEANFDFIKRKGTLVSVGNASGAVPPFAPLKLAAKNIKILRPVLMGYLVTPDETYHNGKALWDLVSKGVVKVNIFKEYAFTAEDVIQAQKDLTSGKTVGKLLIKAH